MHLNLAELVGLGFLTPDQADEYDVYVGIRDPLDKMISSANFLLKRAPEALFRQHNIDPPASVQDVFDRDVIDVLMPILTMPQCHWISDVDPGQCHLLLFESLPDDVATMINRYGGDWNADQMPEKKTGFRDKGKDTAENLLRPESIEQLRDTYREDFEVWQKARANRGTG